MPDPDRFGSYETEAKDINTQAELDDRSAKAASLRRKLIKAKPSSQQTIPKATNPLEGGFNLWRRNPKSPAWLRLTDTSITMAGGPDHAISSDESFGNIIKGPTSIIAKPSEIRIAGLWTMNDLLTSMVPSTIITPVPVLIFNPPLGGTKELANTVKLLTSLII